VSINHLFACVDKHRDQIIATYLTLHGIPEPAWQEYQTSKYVRERLKNAGYHVMESKLGTEVVAHAKAPVSPLVGLRADLDCLIHVIDGSEQYIHSCGHDAHTTMVLCAGELIAQEAPEMAQHVKLIFQPAEEVGEGARKLIEAGAADDLSYLAGIHLRPNNEIGYGLAAASVRHAASLTLTYEIVGKGAHTGRPHLGDNAADGLMMAAAAVNAIKLDPLSCATVNVVSMRTGAASPNIIPDHAQLVVNARLGTNELVEEARLRIDRAVEQGTLAVGTTSRLVHSKVLPAAEPSSEMVKIGEKAIVSVLGEKGLVPTICSSGSEDFHFFSQLSNLKTTFFGLGANLVPGLHCPDMSFDLEALIHGVKILIAFVWYTVEEYGC